MSIDPRPEANTDHLTTSKRLRKLLSVSQSVIEHAENLKANLPDLKNLLEDTTWEAFRSRIKALETRGDSPTLLCVLYGPTGSGKSALFRMLTGLDVPSGALRRPMSFATCVAIPQDIDGPSNIFTTLFPDFTLSPIDNLEELKNPERKNDSPDRLYWKNYQPPSNHTPLIFLDVPDFNSTETANQQRAEKVMARAEICLFVVYPESATTKATIEQLETCLSLSANVILVMTKVTDGESQVESMYQQVRSILMERFPDSDANLSRRPNGSQPALQTVFWSPIAISPCQPSLEDIKTLSSLNDSPVTLKSVFDNQINSAILVQSIIRPIASILPPLRETLNQAAEQSEHARIRYKEASDYSKACAQRIAEKAFPITRFFQILHEELDKLPSSLPPKIEAFTKSVSGITSRVIKRLPKRLVSQLLADGKPVPQAEVDAVRTELQTLFSQLRSHFKPPDTDCSLLKESRFQSLLNEVVQTLPPADDKWEAEARVQIRSYLSDHPNAVKTARIVVNVASIVGVSAIAIDFTLVGGLGTMGALTTAGSVPLLVKLLEKLGIRTITEKIAHIQQKRRADVLHIHINKLFLRPMLTFQWEFAIDRNLYDKRKELLSASDELGRLINI